MQAISRISTPEADVAGLPEAAGGDCYVPLDSGSMHDLLSPVSQMCLMADLVLQKHRGELDGETAVHFTFIKESADRLHSLLSGLRIYRQIVGARVQFRRCDVNALLVAALAMVGPPIEESGAVVTHDPLPELNCDPHQITYTFASLIQNAIKFRGKARPEIHVSAMARGDSTVYSFRDNGIGIDPRYGESIFGVFRRLHRDSYPGTGMGLAIAKGVVRRHGGLIWVESALGKGATFHLALPTAENGGTCL